MKRQNNTPVGQTEKASSTEQLHPGVNNSVLQTNKFSAFSIVVRGTPQKYPACTFIGVIAGLAMVNMDRRLEMVVQSNLTSWVQEGTVEYIKWLMETHSDEVHARAEDVLLKHSTSLQIVNDSLCGPILGEEKEGLYKTLGQLVKTCIPHGSFAIIIALGVSIVLYRLLPPDNCSESQYAFFDSHGRNMLGLEIGEESFFVIFNSAEGACAHLENLFASATEGYSATILCRSEQENTPPIEKNTNNSSEALQTATSSNKEMSFPYAHKTPSKAVQDIIRKYYPKKVREEAKFHALAPTTALDDKGIHFTVPLLAKYD